MACETLPTEHCSRHVRNRVTHGGSQALKMPQILENEDDEHYHKAELELVTKCATQCEIAKDAM